MQPMGHSGEAATKRCHRERMDQFPDSIIDGTPLAATRTSCDPTMLFASQSLYLCRL